MKKYSTYNMLQHYTFWIHFHNTALSEFNVLCYQAKRSSLPHYITGNNRSLLRHKWIVCPQSLLVLSKWILNSFFFQALLEALSTPLVCLCLFPILFTSVFRWAPVEPSHIPTVTPLWCRCQNLGRPHSAVNPQAVLLTKQQQQLHHKLHCPR